MQNLEKNIHNIYDIGIKAKELYHIIEENEGEIDDEQYSLLQFEKSEIKTVGKDILSLYNIIDSQLSMILNEKMRLEDLELKKEKQLEKIRKALMWVLLNFGEQDKKGIWRLDLDIAQLSTRKNPESVVIEDESLVPNDYKKFDYSIKNLSKEDLNFIEKLVFNSFEYKEEDLKITQKVSKKELKPVLVELQQNTSKIENDYKIGALDDESYRECLETIPNLGAYIKEGDLNLVIK